MFAVFVFQSPFKKQQPVISLSLQTSCVGSTQGLHGKKKP